MPRRRTTQPTLALPGQPARRSKFRNVRTTYNGMPFDSKAEAAYAAGLDLRVRAGELRGWIRQPRFMLGLPECTYKPDFLVWRPDGSSFAVDVKGARTRAFDRNVKLWRRYAPCELVIVTKGREEVVAVEGTQTP